VKRYLVFAGAHYYPGGGWNDFIGSYDSEDAAEDEARSVLAKNDYSWAQVVDSESETEVEFD
jgi:autonomous glycyl radical cofactor GrcA